jgi:hypothetical protein
MIAMLNVFGIFAGLDPLLQAAAILTLIAIISIAAFPLWRFIQRRRSRRREARVWIHY